MESGWRRKKEEEEGRGGGKKKKRREEKSSWGERDGKGLCDSTTGLDLRAQRTDALRDKRGSSVW